jgi:hypothetical protein
MTTALRTHEFNTRWWGAPVGLVADPAFFAQPAAARADALAGYDWVECRGAADPGFQTLADTGFHLVDLQIPFRIGLHLVPPSSSADGLTATFASETPFTVDAAAMRTFRHERFSRIPGVTPERLADRYARWSNELIAAHPDTCLAVHDQGRLQGWFLSRPLGGSLQLTLAMLHRDAGIPGSLLYHKALLTHARRGTRIGEASFSAANTDVLNLYARLGARFLAAEPCYLWINPRLRPETP